MGMKWKTGQMWLAEGKKKKKEKSSYQYRKWKSVRVTLVLIWENKSSLWKKLQSFGKKWSAKKSIHYSYFFDW